ncbi:MAG: hypothetical protein ACM3JG_16925 [Thiohalocapsa sp.]
MDDAESELSALMTERLAHGQAALWLSESLILALINTGVVDKDLMLEAIDVVIAAKRGEALGGSEPEIATASVALLASISVSIAAAKASAVADGDARRPRRRPRRKTAATMR